MKQVVQEPVGSELSKQGSNPGRPASESVLVGVRLGQSSLFIL